MDGLGARTRRLGGRSCVGRGLDAVKAEPQRSTHQDREPSWIRGPQELPGIEPEKAREVPLRHLAIRFAFGAATSVTAGVVSLVSGSRISGVLLAFPAILAASLTLIADEESKREAREDARGAVLGA